MNKILKTFIIAIILLTAVAGTVRAGLDSLIDTTRKASLTIILTEKINNSTENTPLKDAEFSLYKVDKTIQKAEDVNISQSTFINKLTTDETGTITFSDLEVGRYFVVQSKVPKNATSKVESFLIDLPRSSEDGKSWEYDVTIYPKLETIYGNVTLTHKSADGIALDGTNWNLQKQDAKGNWEDYSGYVIQQTDINGELKVSNLEKGNYRFVQVTEKEGYIFDKSRYVEFSIDAKNNDLKLTATSQRVDLKHYVKLSNGEYGHDVGNFTTSKVSWKTSVNVVENIKKLHTFIIYVDAPEGINFDTSSLYVYAINKNDETIIMPVRDFFFNISEKEVSVEFRTDLLTNYKEVFLTYDSTFDGVEKGEFTTNARIEYQKIVAYDESKESYESEELIGTKTGKATTYTAKLLAKKTDEAGKALEGAIFKIATSKENAEKGEFVKDSNEKDIVVTSDSEGNIIFSGLKIGEDNDEYKDATSSYWLVEIQSPSYEENGETKHYNQLEEPFEVTVSKDSDIYSEEKTAKVVNTKPFTLPLTGGYLKIIPIIIGTMFIILAIIIKPKNKKKEEKVETK